MNEVKCTIPAEMLHYTYMALNELAIRQKMAAGYPSAGWDVDPEVRKQVEEAEKASDFYFELYCQREGTA